MTEQEIEAIRARRAEKYYIRQGDTVVTDWAALFDDFDAVFAALDAARASQRERELRLIGYLLREDIHENETKETLAAFEEQEKARPRIP